MSKGSRNFKKPVKPENLKHIQKKNRQIMENSQNSLEDKKQSECLEENLNSLKALFKDCFDVIFREFTLGESGIKCLLVYIQDIVNIKTVNDNFFIPFWKILMLIMWN